MANADWLFCTSSLDPPRQASYVVFLSYLASWRSSLYIIEGVSLELRTNPPFPYVNLPVYSLHDRFFHCRFFLCPFFLFPYIAEAKCLPHPNIRCRKSHARASQRSKQVVLLAVSNLLRENIPGGFESQLLDSIVSTPVAKIYSIKQC